VSGVLSVRNLTTGYQHAPVLRDVSVEVGDEIVALFGPNGAGKTTLLRAISGMLRTWSGSVAVNEHEITRASPWRRVGLGVGHVPEGRQVFGAMTVEENLDVAGLAARNPARTRAEIYELFPRLVERRNQPAGTLSGGEQQMLAIGRALMTEPRVLLVDEMSAGLAPIVAQQLVEGLRAVRERGLAIFLVEQSPALVTDVVDRVYVLDRGQITAEGTIDEIGGTERLASIYLAR
jgi:branched-chain amino acid transport system ATP-binding protein